MNNTDLANLTIEELLWVAGRLESSGTASPESLAEKLARSGRDDLADKVSRLGPHQYQRLLRCAAHASAAYEMGLELGLNLAEQEGEPAEALHNEPRVPAPPERSRCSADAYLLLVADVTQSEPDNESGLTSVSAYPSESALRTALQEWVAQNTEHVGDDELGIEIRRLLLRGLPVEAANLLSREGGFWWVCYARAPGSVFSRVRLADRGVEGP